MSSIPLKLQQVRTRIEQACRAHARPVQSVTLLAVSKTHPANAVRQAYAAGQRHFGENYVQEALAKKATLADLPGLQWHLIGPIQSNKTREVAAHFDWVHSVDRLKIAQRLSDQRPSELADLNVCLQVNLSGEPSKAGFVPHAVLAAAQSVATMPRLRLRGLMSIPEASTDVAVQRQRHRELATLLMALKADSQQAAGPHAFLDTLSMGMSDDMASAIAEGSTIVRVGTAIFGVRAAGAGMA
jgi:PLP dependent protein